MHNVYLVGDHQAVKNAAYTDEQFEDIQPAIIWMDGGQWAQSDTPVA